MKGEDIEFAYLHQGSLKIINAQRKITPPLNTRALSIAEIVTGVTSSSLPPAPSNA